MAKQKIIHFLIKVSNLVQYVLDSYHFIVDTVPLKLSIISKNTIKNALEEAIKVHRCSMAINAKTLHLYRGNDQI